MQLIPALIYPFRMRIQKDFLFLAHYCCCKDCHKLDNKEYEIMCNSFDLYRQLAHCLICTVSKNIFLLFTLIKVAIIALR